MSRRTERMGLRVDRHSKSELPPTRFVRHCVSRMVRVKAALNPKQRVSEACGNMAGGVPRPANAERQLVLELNPVAQAVIDVNVGRFNTSLQTDYDRP